VEMNAALVAAAAVNGSVELLEGDYNTILTLSVAVNALPAVVDSEPSPWTSRYLLGAEAAHGGGERAWLETYVLARLLPQGGKSASDPTAARAALALLGTGRQLVPGGPTDAPGALQVTRTYPGKVAAVARRQERFVPLVRAGLWTVVSLLSVAALAAAVQMAWGVSKSDLSELVSQALVAVLAAAVVVLVVLPIPDPFQVYSESARLAEQEAVPRVLVARTPPAPLPNEQPIRLPAPQLVGERPRMLVWEPDLQTDRTGVIELELPEGAVQGRLRVSVLAIVPGHRGQVTVGGATFVLRPQTTTQTVALLPLQLPRTPTWYD